MARARQVKPKMHPRDLQANLLLLRDAGRLMDARRTLEAFSGVYLLFDGDEVVYVGQSMDLTRRLWEHKLKGAFQFDGYVAVKFPPAHLDYYEAMAISHHQPRYNQNCPTRPSGKRPKEARQRRKVGISQPSENGDVGIWRPRQDLNLRPTV